MRQLLSSIEFNQQMTPEKTRQIRPILEAIVPDNGAAWSKFSPSEEIADLLKWCAVLQGKTHQAGSHVVETDQLRSTVGHFEAKEDSCGVFVVMHAEVDRALTGFVANRNWRRTRMCRPT